MIEESGGETEVGVSDQGTRGVGITTEFCIGGPLGNSRTETHLKRFAPGFHMEPWLNNSNLAMAIGDTTLTPERGKEEHALIFKVVLRDSPSTPLWVICGQVAISNQAAVRHLRLNWQALLKRFGPDKSFCIAVKVIESSTYGFEHVEEMFDCTTAAFRQGPVQ